MRGSYIIIKGKNNKLTIQYIKYNINKNNLVYYIGSHKYNMMISDNYLLISNKMIHGIPLLFVKRMDYDMYFYFELFECNRYVYNTRVINSNTGRMVREFINRINIFYLKLKPPHKLPSELWDVIYNDYISISN